MTDSRIPRWCILFANGALEPIVELGETEKRVRLWVRDESRVCDDLSVEIQPVVAEMFEALRLRSGARILFSLIPIGRVAAMKGRMK